MQKRVFNVLLVASRYDAFIMEEDGRVEEQIYFEYVSLNLSSPPRVKQVTTNEEAFEELAMKRYDLIITMPGVDCSETFTQAKAMKRLYPYIPIVVLTPFTGKLLFLPLINIASLATVVMWVMSLAAVLALRKSHPDWRRPVSMPGGRITAVCGIIASVFLAGNLLVPFSPGALSPLEYALAAALAALGLALYHFRDRSLSDAQRTERILGSRGRN